MNVLLLGGLFAALYAISKTNDKKRQEELDTTEELMEQSYKGAPDVVKEYSEKGDEVYRSPLVIKVEIKVSGFEKMFASKKDIKKDIKKAAITIANTLPNTCPGAPKLLGTPTVSIKDSSKGYIAQVSWLAEWSHQEKGPIREIVALCLKKQLLQKAPDLKARLRSFEATRV